MDKSIIFGTADDYSQSEQIFIVVEVDRHLLGRGVVETQKDIKILSAFSKKEDALRYVNEICIGKTCVIHESILNPVKHTFQDVRSLMKRPNYTN